MRGRTSIEPTMRRFAAMLGCIATLACMPACPASATPDTNASDPCGEAAFAAVRGAMSRVVYPPALTYDVVIHGVRGGVEHRARYAGETDLREHRIFVDRFSVEEAAHPYVPRGIDVYLTFTVGTGRGGSETTGTKITSDEPTLDILGTPHLAPTYAFDLARDPAGPTPPLVAGSLRVIGATSTTRRDYAVRCLDASAGESDVVHLALTPLRDPHRLRLRELWLDPRTSLPLRLRTAGNFASGPPLGADWLVTFGRVDGVPLIVRETALTPLDFGQRRVYAEATVEFANLAWTTEPTTRVMFASDPRPDDLREP
jgi:hypothetical protein